MKKIVLYKYLGTNGVITSPILLEGVYCVKSYSLVADTGMILTNGKEFFTSITVPENELNNWEEVPDGGQL